jgi:hypothetical protein
MAAVKISFTAKGSQAMKSADMRHRCRRRPDIGGGCGRIEAQKAPSRFDLPHVPNTGCAGKFRVCRLIWINAP